MINFRGDAILLDIEGTTSSVTFVYDVMFPYVRDNLRHFLAKNWGDHRLEAQCEQIASDAEPSSSKLLTDRGLSDAVRQGHISAEVLRQMDADMKVTGLKALQGDIWKAGFKSGALVAHVYDDVVPNLEAWKASGFSIRIYSSGSVAAQRLFFAHTHVGDLLPLFDGHYDTTIGSKRSSTSYCAIADDWKQNADQVLFVSDVPAELDAAAQAGMRTALCCRDELLSSEHLRCNSFDEIRPIRSASK